MRELKKILFLCTGNSCRSQMAEGIAKKFTCFQAFSAGTKKSELDSYAVKVMSEIKIDISDQFSKSVNELEDKDFEYVFTLCSCLLYTSPSPRDLSTSRMPSSA